MARSYGIECFPPLWHVCNGAPWVRIKIIVYLVHGELISGQISYKHIIFKVKHELLVIIILWNQRLSLNIPQFWTGHVKLYNAFQPIVWKWKYLIDYEMFQVQEQGESVFNKLIVSIVVTNFKVLLNMLSLLKNQISPAG